jgi:hypothetical protein
MKTITLEVEDNYWLEILKLIKQFPIKIIEEKNSDANTQIQHKTPLEEIGFIGCGSADADLSVNYKDKLTHYLKEKHSL